MDRAGTGGEAQPEAAREQQRAEQPEQGQLDDQHQVIGGAAGRDEVPGQELQQAGARALARPAGQGDVKEGGLAQGGDPGPLVPAGARGGGKALA